MNFLLVALGGFIGSIARYQISLFTTRRLIGTWIANITGSMLLAVLWYFYITQFISEFWWLLFGVGFCGAYTTFSTFGNETMKLLQNKEYKLAICYVFASLLISFITVASIFYIL